jgi:hypothetical protein
VLCRNRQDKVKLAFDQPPFRNLSQFSRLFRFLEQEGFFFVRQRLNVGEFSHVHLYGIVIIQLHSPKSTFAPTLGVSFPRPTKTKPYDHPLRHKSDQEHRERDKSADGYRYNSDCLHSKENTLDAVLWLLKSGDLTL